MPNQVNPASPSARPRSRTIVYVDGFNLYYGCLKDTPYKWLDVCRLSELLLPHDDIIAVKYYTARVSARPGNPSAPTNQQVYLRALRTLPRVSITYGSFLTHSVKLPLSGVTPTKRVWVDRTEEKGSDVNLAVHLVRDAYEKQFQTAVLLTNDSDLVEPVRIVREEFGLPVGIVNPHQHHSVELKRVATFLKRIRQQHLIGSQFPAIVHDAKGDIHKPSSW